MPKESLNQKEPLDYSNWKAIKRELAALDILDSDNIVRPEEFVKTKHHCYVVKEYINGGTIAQLL
jgi:serine/threonine protein kinase